MGSEEPTSMDAYVSVTREVLAAIRVRDGLAVSYIVQLDQDELKENFPYSSLTFYQEETVRTLFENYEPEQIPKWDDGGSANKILQTYYMRCPLDQKEMKAAFNVAFEEGSEEREKYESIRKLMKHHFNTTVKTAFAEFLALGSLTADFLEEKYVLWQEATNEYQAWRTMRDDFHQFIDNEEATVQTVNEKYANLSGALVAASDKMENFLKLSMKKAKHLTQVDILRANNYSQETALEDSLKDIIEDTTLPLLTTKTQLRAKEFFQDWRIAASNDRDELNKFRRNAKNKEQAADSNTEITEETPAENRSPGDRRNSNRDNRNDVQVETEKEKRKRERIQKAAIADMKESERLYREFESHNKPDKVYESKIVTVLSNLQDLLRETQREERTSVEDYVVYHDMSRPEEGGESLAKLLKEQIQQLTSTKLKLADLDKKHAKAKEDRLKLIDTFQIKKIVKDEDFIVWYEQYKDFCEKVFKDDIIDVEEDNVKQKLIRKLENTLPAEEVKKLEPWKTVGEKMSRFIANYEKNIPFLVEKNISEILKMKPPDNDEKASQKNIEIFLQRIATLFKLDCLYMIQKSHLDNFPKKIFTNFTLRKYNDALPKFKNLDAETQNKLLESGDMNILEQYFNVVSNNELLKQFQQNFLPNTSNNSSSRRQTILTQGANALLETQDVSQIDQIKNSLKKVSVNLNQSKLNSNTDKVFYFLVVFSTKENQTLTEKLSSLGMKTEAQKEKREVENNRNKNQREKFSKKPKNPAKNTTKRNVLLNKSSHTNNSPKGRENSKTKEYPRNKELDKGRNYKSNNERKPTKQTTKRIPWHACPLGCRNKDNVIHKVKYGSASFCRNFWNMTLSKREQILKDKVDILKCCLRAQNSPLGHQRGDKLNCRVKKCQTCNRWGHSSLLCRDPAAPHNKNQQKSVKMTQRRQIEEPDPEYDEEEEYEEEECEEEEYEEEQTEEYLEENESTYEDDEGEYSEYDDSSEENDIETNQGDESDEPNEEGNEEDMYDTETESDFENNKGGSSLPKINVVKRKIRMLKAQTSKAKDIPTTQRKNPQRNCKKSEKESYAYVTQFPNLRKRLPPKYKKKKKKQKQTTNITLNLINEIVQKKLVDILDKAVRNDSILSVLTNMNNTRMSEIHTMSMVVKKLNECEKEYLKFLIKTNNQQMDPSLVLGKMEPPNNNLGGYDPVRSTNQETSISTQETQNPHTNTQDDGEFPIQIENCETMEDFTPDEMFSQAESSENEPITGESVTEYLEELRIFKEEYLYLYNEEEELDTHANNLRNILQEGKSLLSLVNLMDMSNQKLECCMNNLQAESAAAYQVEKGNLKKMTNVLIHLARKRTTRMVDQNDISELQETNTNPRVVRMIRRVQDTHTSGEPTSPISSSNSSDYEDDNIRIDPNRSKVEISLEHSVRLATNALIKEGENFLFPIIHTKLDKAGELIERVHNQVIIYRDDPKYDCYVKGIKLKVTEMEKSAEEIYKDKRRIYSKSKVIMQFPVEAKEPDGEKRYGFISEMVKDNEEILAYCRHWDGIDKDRFISMKTKGNRFFEIWGEKFELENSIIIPLKPYPDDDPASEGTVTPLGQCKQPCSENEANSDTPINDSDILEILDKEEDDELALSAFQREFIAIYGRKQDLRYALSQINLLGPFQHRRGINYFLKLVVDTRNSIYMTCQKLMEHFNLEHKRFEAPVLAIAKCLINLLHKKLRPELEKYQSDEESEDDEFEGDDICASSEDDLLYPTEDELEEDDGKETGLSEIIIPDITTRIMDYTRADGEFDINPKDIERTIKETYGKLERDNLRSLPDSCYTFYDKWDLLQESRKLVVHMNFESMTRSELKMWRPRHDQVVKHDTPSYLIITKVNIPLQEDIWLPDKDVCCKLISYCPELNDCVHFWNPISRRYEVTNLYHPSNKYLVCTYKIEIHQPVGQGRNLRLLRRQNEGGSNNPEQELESDNSDDEGVLEIEDNDDESQESADEPEQEDPAGSETEVEVISQFERIGTNNFYPIRHNLNLLFTILPRSKLHNLVRNAKAKSGQNMQMYYTMHDLVCSVATHMGEENLRLPDNPSIVKSSPLLFEILGRDYFHAGELVHLLINFSVSLVLDHNIYRDVVPFKDMHLLPQLPTEAEAEKLMLYPPMRDDFEEGFLPTDYFNKAKRFKIKEPLKSLLVKHSKRITAEREKYTWNEIHVAGIETLELFKNTCEDERNPNILHLFLEDSIYEVLKVRTIHRVNLSRYLIPHLEIISEEGDKTEEETQDSSEETSNPRKRRIILRRRSATSKQAKLDNPLGENARNEPEVKLGEETQASSSEKKYRHQVIYKRGGESSPCKWWFGSVSDPAYILATMGRVHLDNANEPHPEYKSNSTSYIQGQTNEGLTARVTNSLLAYSPDLEPERDKNLTEQANLEPEKEKNPTQQAEYIQELREILDTDDDSESESETEKIVPHRILSDDVDLEDGDLDKEIAITISNLQQSECDLIIAWRSAMNFRNNSSLLEFVQKQLQEDFKEQFIFEEIYDAVVNYIKRKKLFDETNPTIVVADNNLTHALGYKYLHYKEIFMCIMQHVDIHCDFRIKLMRERQTPIAAHAIYDNMDEERAKRIIVTFFCKRKGVDYDIRYLNFFQSFVSPTCNISLVSEVRNGGVVPFTRVISHAERDELSERLFTSGHLDRGTIRSDIFGLSNIDSQQSREIRTHKCSVDRENTIVRPFFMPSNIPTDEYMMDHMKKTWGNTQMKEEDKTAPYKVFMSGTGSFANVVQVDTARLYTYTQKPVYSLHSTTRAKHKFLRVNAEIPIQQNICVRAEVGKKELCPYSIAIKRHKNKDIPIYEIGHSLEGETKPEEECLRGMIKLGQLIVNGQATYDQVTKMVTYLKVCFNCGLEQPVECVYKCHDQQYIMRHPQRAVNALRDPRFVKEKPEPNYYPKMNKISMDDKFVFYQTENFHTAKMKDDPEAYYKRRFQEKTNRKIAIEGINQHHQNRNLSLRERPNIKHWYAKSPHILDCSGYPLSLHGQLIRNPTGLKHHTIRYHWVRQCNKAFGPHEYLGVNRGNYGPANQPYKIVCEEDEVVKTEEKPKYRENPAKIRRKDWMKYAAEYQPDRLFDVNCWWNPEDQITDLRYLSRPINPDILKNKIIRIKPKIHAFFMKNKKWMSRGERIDWDFNSKWMNFQTLVDIFRNHLVVTRIPQRHANSLIVNLSNSKLKDLLGIATIHSSQLIYHAQLMIEEKRDIPTDFNPLLGLQLAIKKLNFEEGNYPEAIEILEGMEEEEEEFTVDEEGNIQASDPIVIPDYMEVSDENESEVNFARRICMVKRTNNRKKDQQDMDNDDNSSTVANPDESDAESCKGLEKASIHKYLNDEGPEMDAIAKFTKEKVNGFHTGHDEKIQERLRMEEKGNATSPKKACEAFGNKDIDNSLSGRKILRLAGSSIIKETNKENRRKLEELDKDPLLLDNENVELLHPEHDQYQQIVAEGNNLYNSSERIISDGYDVRIERNKEVDMKRCKGIGLIPEEYLGIPTVAGRCVSDTGANTTVGDMRLLHLGLAERVHGEKQTCYTAGNNSIKATPGRITVVLRNGKKVSISISLVEEVGGCPDEAISQLQKDVYCGIFGISSDIEKYFNFKKKQSDVFILLGTDNSGLQSKQLSLDQIQEFGFKVPTVSPNARIQTNPIGKEVFAISGVIGIDPGLKKDEILIPVGKDRKAAVPVIEYKTVNKCFVPAVVKTIDIQIQNQKEQEKKKVKNDKIKVKIKGKPNKVRYLNKNQVDGDMLDSIIKLAGNDGTHEYNLGLSTDQSLWLGPIDTDKLWNTLLLEEKISNVAKQKGSRKIFMIKRRNKMDNNTETKKQQDVKTIEKGKVLKATKRNKTNSTNEEKENVMSKDERDEAIMYMYLRQLLTENNFPAMQKTCLEHSIAINECSKCNNRGKVSQIDEQLYDMIKHSAKKIIQVDENGKEQVKYQFDLINSNEKSTAELFSPERSNLNRVKKETEKLIKKLKKESLLKAFHENIMETKNKGFIKQLTAEEMENLKKQPHYFVSLNYAVNVHSQSTPVRPVTDTSRQIKGENTSHSKMFISPPGFLNNIEGCLRQATFHELGAALDIKKAYLNIQVSEADALFTLILWKEDPEDDESPWIILRYSSFSFGNSQSSSVLHIMVTEFGANNCKTELGKTILIKFSLADDVITSHPNVDTLWITTKDIMQALEKVGLPCKPPMVSAAAQPDNILNKEVNFREDSFGMARCYLTNSYAPSTELSLYETKRGKPMGKSLENMSDQEILDADITKKHLLRINAKLYDISQKFYAPVLMNGKILYRMVHQLLPNDSEYNKAIKTVSKKLDTHVKDFLLELKYFKKEVGRKPVWGNPQGYTPVSFIVSTDGSGSSVAAVVHMVSIKDDEKTYGPQIFSGLYTAKQQLNSKSTSPISEILSIKMGMQLVSGILEDLKHLLTKPYDVFLLNDNAQMTNNFDPKNGTTKVVVKNAVNMVKASLMAMANHHNLKYIKLAFVSGHLSIADLCSKYCRNMTMVVKSIRWNHGIKEYLSRHLFERTTFVTSTKENGYEYTALPKNISKPTDPELEFLVKPKEREEWRRKFHQAPTTLHTVKMDPLDNQKNQTQEKVQLTKQRNIDKDDFVSYEDYLHNSLYCSSGVNEDTSHSDLAIIAKHFPGVFNNSKYPHFLWTTTRAGAAEVRNTTNFIGSIFKENNNEPEHNNKVNVVTRKQAKEKLSEEKEVLLEDSKARTVSTLCGTLKKESKEPEPPPKNYIYEIETDSSVNIQDESKVEGDWTSNLDSISVKHHNRGEQLSKVCLENFGYNLVRPLDMVENVTTINGIIREFDVMRPKKGSRNLIQEGVSSIFNGFLDKISYDRVVKRYSDGRRTFQVSLSMVMAVIKWKQKLENFRNPTAKNVLTKETATSEQYLLSHDEKNIEPQGSGIQDLSRENSILIFKERINQIFQLDPFVLYHEAWAIMLRSDQKHYPIEKRTNKDTVTTLSKVKVVKDRIDSSKALELFGGNVLPILDKKSPLLMLKIMIAHRRTESDYANPVKFWIGVHLDQVTTKVNLKVGNTGVKCTRVDEVVNEFVSECAPCRRTSQMHFRSYIGVQMHQLDYSTPIFQKISIDPAFAMWVFPSPQSRKPMRIYLLAIACLTTFATRLIPMPNMTLKSIKDSLQQLQLQSSNPLTLVHTDYGTQFSGKLKEILPGVKVECSHRLSQRTNYVENRIRLAKAVMRRIFQKTPKEPLDTKIDLFMLNIIIAIVENSVNSLPFNNKAGSSGITPDHFLRPYQFIKDVLGGGSEDEEHNLRVENKVKSYFEKIIDIRNKEILIEEKRFRRQLGSNGPYEIQVNSIVYVKNPNGKIKIGRVVEISESGISITVYFPDRKKNKKYNVKDLCVLVHNP